MHNSHDPQVLPVRDGVSPSCVVVPTQRQGLLIDFLCERLPAVGRAAWLQRMEAGEVVSEQGDAALPQGHDQGGLVDDGAASGVDEDSARLHAGKGGGIKKADS